QLYRARWNAELDLRSLKQIMQMDILRCKTPESVRKELWAHMLAYNLIRAIMAQAASRHGIEPRSVSFKGAVQTLEAFRPLIAIWDADDSGFGRAITRCCLTRSPATGSGTAPTAMSRAERSADPSHSRASRNQGTRPNVRGSSGFGRTKCHSSHRPRCVGR